MSAADPAELRVPVRVRPGAARIAVGGSYDGALVVAVTAPPVDGRANEAVLRAVADAFGLRRGDVRLLHATTGRSKTVVLTGDAELMGARLAELLAGA